MRYKRFEDTVVVRLETGEYIHKSIEQVCKEEKIMLGTVIGFGGIKSLKIGIWNNEKSAYDYLSEEGKNMEMLNLTGNITMLDNEPNIHMHVTVADNSFRVFGGHLVSGEVQNLAEIFIYAEKGRIDRVPVRSWNFMNI